MPAPLSWPPPNSVLFAASLCLMALIGEVIATAYPGLGNPTKIAFYSFLPVALWMMTIEQRQDVRTIGELEARIATDAAEDDPQQRDRNEWQQNRDTYRKASSRGMSALEYQDQQAAEEYERRVDNKAPSETEFEQVAVVVFFPKLNAHFEGQQESFVIKSKISTLALSGLTPEQARQIAESQTGGDASSSASGGGLPSGGSGSGGAPSGSQGGK